MELSPHPLGLPLQSVVVASLVGLSFTGQLLIVLQALGRKPTRRDGFLHRTAWLLVVAAVPEMTSSRTLCNVVEDHVEPIVVDNLQLAHARRIEQQPPSRQQDQLAVGRDVTSPAVAGSSFSRRHSLLAQDGIDEGRLTRPGRSNKRRGPSGADTRLNRGQTIRTKRARRMDWNTSAPALDLSHASANVHANVSLVEDHRGRGSAGPDSSEVSFYAVKVEILVQAADHEDHIHIGCDDLGKCLAPRGAAGKHRSTREETNDDGRLLGSGWISKRDPITDCGQALTVLPMAKPTC